MYTENPLNDALLFLKAIASNILARVAPALYMKLTRQTGRGDTEEDPGQIAEYYLTCLRDYLTQINPEQPEHAVTFLEGKKVLEYGPGDILGVALLLYAHGASSVDCIDRFPLKAASEKNLEVYRLLVDSLEGRIRERAENAFNERNNPASGFKPEAISYRVSANGISGENKKYDLVISRAVLEHVNNLEQTFHDICNALKNDGISIHEVDMKSHGLDRYRPFDFLTWPVMLYKVMYGAKGFPNRWRVNTYRELAKKSGLKIIRIDSIGDLDKEDVELIRNKAARPFRDISLPDLAMLGFWLVMGHNETASPQLVQDPTAE